MDEQTPQEPGVEQPTEHLPQIYCPRCAGGNPSKSIRCMWCGFPLDQPPLPDRPPSSNLLIAYKRAVIRPSAESLASEVPGASWPRILIGMLTVTVVNILVFAVSLLIAEATFNNLPAPTTGGTGSDTATGASWAFTSMTSMTSIFDFLLGPVILLGVALAIVVGFFLNTLLIYWLCRRFGGVGRTGRFGPDFKVHAYLLSLVTAPVSLATSLVSLVPYVGSFGTLAFSLYSILLQYFAIRASMQMTRNNARMVIAILFVIGAVLGVIIIIVALFFILSAVFSNIFEGSFSRLQPTAP